MPLTRYERKEKLGHGSVREIAKQTGLSESHVSRVLLGRRPDRKVEVVAARRLGMKVADAFPEYYPQPEPAGAVR